MTDPRAKTRSDDGAPDGAPDEPPDEPPDDGAPGASRDERDATPHTLTVEQAGTQPRTSSSPAFGAAPSPSNLQEAARPEERYRLGGEVGRGGLGRVTLAHDDKLGRTVALKELHSPSPQARRRFEREIRLTARLQHPAIVPVYDAGRWSDGEPFYAMRLVQGGTLKEAIASAAGVRERLALLPHVVTAAEAVAYAHQQGIVHRDIKPTNVLVGELGETLVVDWGIAKDLRAAAAPDDRGAADDDGAAPAPAPAHDHGAAADNDATARGALLGTPAYMAPEQARGDDAGPAADIYALGALLYHVLAGAAPYASADVVTSAGDAQRRVLAALLSGPPRPLRSLSPQCPDELVAIVDGAMARDPARRYHSALDLVADLRRFQTGQLVGAYRYTRRERLARFVKKNRVAVTAAALAVVVVAVVVLVSVDRVVRERDVARARSRALTLVQAKTSLDKDPTAALAWLKSMRDDDVMALDAADEERFRAVAAEAVAKGVALDVLDFGIKIENVRTAPAGPWAFIVTDRTLWVWDSAQRRFVAGHDADDPLDVRFTPDGRRAVTIGRQGTLRALPGIERDDAGAARALGRGAFDVVSCTGDKAWANDHALLPDNVHALLASPDGRVRLCDMKNGGEPVVVTTHTGGASAVDASADGSLIASTGADATIALSHRSADGTFVLSRRVALPAPGFVVRFIGDDLFAVDKGGGVWRLDVNDAQAGLVSLGAGTARPDEIDITPDRMSLVAGFHDGSVVVYRHSGERIELRGHTAELVAVTISHDGQRVASGGLDRTVRVWNTATRTAKVLLGHSGVIEGVAFSADGSTLFSGGQDGTVRVWDVRDDGSDTYAGHTDDIYAVRVSPDGRIVATAAKDKTVRLWKRDTGESQLLTTMPLAAYSLSFSRDGRFLAASGYGTDVYAWPLRADGFADLEAVKVLTGHTGAVWRVDISPDSRHVVSASSDGTVRAWDTATFTGRVLHAHDSEGALFVVTSPDSRFAASAGMDKTARLSRLDVDAGTADESSTRVLRGHTERLLRVAFSPDSQTLATGSWDKTVRLWRTDTGAAVDVIGGHGGRVRSLVFSRDGRALYTGTDDDTVRVVDLGARGGGHAEDAGVVVLGHHGNYVRELELSADGAVLASLGWDESVRLWDLRHRVLVGLERRSDVLMSVVFAPAAVGRDVELVLGGYPKVVDLRPLSRATSLPVQKAALSAFVRGQGAAVIDERSEVSSLRPTRALIESPAGTPGASP